MILDFDAFITKWLLSYHSFMAVTHFCVHSCNCMCLCVLPTDNDSCEEVYQAVIVLHCLVSAADILLHGCLQAAVVQLSSLLVKHQTLLKGTHRGLCFVTTKLKITIYMRKTILFTSGIVL